MEITNQTAKEILEAVYIPVTDNKIETVKKVVNAELSYESNTITIGNEVCDTLQIERRSNRQAIAQILNNLKK